MDYWYTFYQRYREDDNEWWRLSEGDMQNLFEDAAAAAVGFEKTATEQLARAEAAEAENKRLREEVALLRYVLRTVINGERNSITTGHIDMALDALQETA